MNIAKFFIFSFLNLMLVNPVWAETVAPFKNGERVIYAIKKMGLKVGEATLIFEGEREIGGQKVYTITFKATAPNFYDEEKIYVWPETFKPLRVERDLNIFGKKEKIVEVYDSAQGSIAITKTAGGNKSEQIINKSGEVDNIYGIIFRYRKEGAFHIGDKIAMNLPTADIELKMRRQEKLSAAGKTYQAYYMESVPSKYRLWFDDSAQKIPLRIDGAVGFGNTVMILQKYSTGQ